MRCLLTCLLLISGCTTKYFEVKGECVMQSWHLVGQTMRERLICDLPPPDDDEVQVRDREEMDTNPFPDLFDLDNQADTPDPNLLEKKMGYPQEPDNE